MNLQQNGPSVSGTYKHSDGRIEGTISGNTLTGTWTQSNGKGRIVFVFTPDASVFTGKWGYDDAEPSGQWNGKRKGGATVQAPAATGTSTALPPASGEILFNNWNKAAVNNTPVAATYFYLGRPATLTRITNYHWNNGYGKEPGLIGIKNANGNMVGTWQATSTSGTGGAQNVNWVVSPNVALEPGFYQITDSDPGTWSQNSGSCFSGFSMVQGQ